MTRYLITGANGQVGHALQQQLQGNQAEIIALTRHECDLSQTNTIPKLLHHYQPDIILNAAAFTAVDQAEDSPDLANTLNAAVPGLLANWALQNQALLVHYSTDYVFDGTQTQPYGETDQPNPQSVYGKTKWEGEKAIRESGCQHLILRTSWVFSTHGHNFLKTILRLAQQRQTLSVVADQVGAPTSAKLIATITIQAIIAALRGTFHLCAHGMTSWHEYAQTIVRHAHALNIPLILLPENILPVSTETYGAKAPRPHYSLLNCHALEQALSITLPSWQDDVCQTITLLTPQGNMG